jgi:hypothetical protein
LKTWGFLFQFLPLILHIDESYGPMNGFDLSHDITHGAFYPHDPILLQSLVSKYGQKWLKASTFNLCLHKLLLYNKKPLYGRWPVILTYHPCCPLPSLLLITATHQLPKMVKTCQKNNFSFFMGNWMVSIYQFTIIIQNRLQANTYESKSDPKREQTT